MLKIDIDKIARRSRFNLQKIMYCIPRPFYVRVSSGGNGIHVRAPLCGEWDYRRIAYDDPMRIQLDEQRTRHRLPVKNLLWNIKNGKHAGLWWIIQNEKHIERFIDINKPQKGL